MPERRQRLGQAEMYLAEAETFYLALKGYDVTVFLRTARAEVAAAKEKLEKDAGTPSKP